MYYYGARYLDSKYSRWLSTDPALGEYVPGVGADSSKLPGLGGVYNTVNLNLYHYAGNNPVKYTDPNGLSDTAPLDLKKEASDIVSEFKIGIVDKFSVSIPNVASIELELNLVSNDFINNKVDTSDSGMTSGIALKGQIGPEECPIASINFEYSKKSPEIGNAFSLLDYDYEFSTESKINTDVEVTPPTPFVNMTFNLTEAADFIIKSVDYIKKQIEAGRE